MQQYYNLHLTTAWFGLLMMDNLFFLEKIQAGPYWFANALYGLKLRKFWGAVFEKYVNKIMAESCAGTKAVFIPDPTPADDPNLQICDGIVVSDDSLVLMEYKSSMFRADTKYSGNHHALAGEIEKKLVHDKEAGERNFERLKAFRREVQRQWLGTLRKRTQRHRFTWEQFSKLVVQYLPKPRILHPYPEVRFDRQHSR